MSSISLQLIAHSIANRSQRGLEIADLTPGTSYKVRVAGYYDEGIGPFSNFSIAMTYKCMYLNLPYFI